MLDYINIEGLKSIDALWLGKVEDAAAGLSEDEVLLLLKTPRSRLNKVELEWFKYAHEVGRAKGLNTAVSNLFQSMRDKGGQTASLAYLAKFSKEWSEESAPAGSGAFTFSVTKTALPAKPKKED